MENIDFKMQS